MRRGMNLEEAMEILDVVQGEDKAKIRKKYRSLMRRYHPDALGSDRPEQIRRVQQMNEAYHLLMKQEVPILRSARKRRKWEWTGTVNADAFCERNVYLHYSMDVEGEPLYYQAARGEVYVGPGGRRIQSVSYKPPSCCERAAGTGGEKTGDVPGRGYPAKRPSLSGAGKALSSSHPAVH